MSPCNGQTVSINCQNGALETQIKINLLFSGGISDSHAINRKTSFGPRRLEVALRIEYRGGNSLSNVGRDIRVWASRDTLMRFGRLTKCLQQNSGSTIWILHNRRDVFTSKPADKLLHR